MIAADPGQFPDIFQDKQRVCVGHLCYESRVGACKLGSGKRSCDHDCSKRSGFVAQSK